jgi:glycosyltransferase involved in cell wall biosynthesis
MTARTIGRASRIITWSDWCARSVIATYEADPGKVKVIFPGIPLERWEPRQHRRPGPVRLLFVGTKFVRKGGRHLFDALREVSGAWEIHVVNRDDDIPDDGRTIVHRGLSPDDGSLVEIYRQADIFVLPTIGDALPMALLEAMAVGLPVIATRVGGIPEVVREGETGMLVEVGDVDGLAAAIQTLVNDPALRVAMGVAGRRLALARHDASRVYLGHLDAMKEVADRSSGR